MGLGVVVEDEAEAEDVDEDREAVDGDLVFAGARILDVGRQAAGRGDISADKCCRRGPRSL